MVTPASTRAKRSAEVDLEDAAHLGQRDDDRVFLRDRAAGERRAGAARHDIDLLVAAKAHDARDLLGRARQRDGERQAAVGGQRVGLESAPARFVGDQAVGRQERARGPRAITRGRRMLVRRRKGDVDSRRQGCLPVMFDLDDTAALLGEAEIDRYAPPPAE